MTNNSIKIENSEIKGANIVSGIVKGKVTALINELPDSSEPNKPGIKESLTQLQKAIEAESNLSQEDKEEALKKLQSLAEAGKNPQGNQQKAKGAIRFLKGLFIELPKTAKLIEQWKKLLPAIASFFGFEN
ncbi:MAG: hypothetical protein F6K40_20095 [Okeania sp. SIO3I5]|uniref:hypothetical protein n=1 Tax=Okeania sp. SIO3I5 TaxID=2607805 RepID=UPI0013B68E62|nr:hypothetical protein [Okeania sp. SIO3I5]NEQ38443.1 hypothetical protein [Okeania sp. SIO3I5]